MSCETADQLHCDQGTCQEVRLCVQPGMIVGFAAHHEPVKRALGRCNEDGSTCPSGSACETLRACVGARFPARGSFIVLPPEEPAPSHRRGLLAAEAAMTVFVVLVVVGFLVAGRQRRRRT